jgi:hypothetical protein
MRQAAGTAPSPRADRQRSYQQTERSPRGPSVRGR